MTPALRLTAARAQAKDAARPLIRKLWPTPTSTTRIGALCGLTDATVRELAREMRLPERAAGGNRRVAMGRVG